MDYSPFRKGSTPQEGGIYCSSLPAACLPVGGVGRCNRELTLRYFHLYNNFQFITKSNILFLVYFIEAALIRVRESGLCQRDPKEQKTAQ